MGAGFTFFVAKDHTATLHESLHVAKMWLYAGLGFMARPMTSARCPNTMVCCAVRRYLPDVTRACAHHHVALVVDGEGPSQRHGCARLCVLLPQRDAPQAHTEVP